MKEYNFRLTVESTEDGKTRYETFREYDCQGEMSCGIAHAVSDALEACFIEPPIGSQMMVAMNSMNYSLDTGFGMAHSTYWTGENDFKDAVSICIDIDKLMEGSESKEINLAAKILENHGIKIVRSA